MEQRLKEHFVIFKAAIDKLATKLRTLYTETEEALVREHEAAYKEGYKTAVEDHE